MGGVDNSMSDVFHFMNIIIAILLVVVIAKIYNQDIKNETVNIREEHISNDYESEECALISKMKHNNANAIQRRKIHREINEEMKKKRDKKRERKKKLIAKKVEAAKEIEQFRDTDSIISLDLTLKNMKSELLLVKRGGGQLFSCKKMIAKKIEAAKKIKENKKLNEEEESLVNIYIDTMTTYYINL